MQVRLWQFKYGGNLREHAEVEPTPLHEVHEYRKILLSSSGVAFLGAREVDHARSLITLAGGGESNVCFNQLHGRAVKRGSAVEDTKNLECIGNRPTTDC